MSTMTAPKTRPDTTRAYIRVKTDVLAAVVDLSGYSHSELAIKAKLKSPATISNLTSGYRRTCHRDTAKKLARALKVDAGKLFEVVA